MWLQSGSLIHEPPSGILHLEAFDSEWKKFRSELLSAHNFKLFPTASELKSFGPPPHVASQDPTRERQLMTEFLQQRPGYRAALCRLLEPDYHCFRRYATVVDLCAQEVRRGWHA